MRQAQQLIEPLGKTQPRQALAQAKPAAIAFRRAHHCAQQRREINIGIEWDVYLDERQPRRRNRLSRRFGGGFGYAHGLPLARLDLAVAWHPTPATAGPGGFATRGLARPEDPFMAEKEPGPPCPAAGKGIEGTEPVGKPMSFEQRTRGPKLVLLRKGQGAQQVIGVDR